jgi:polysaccharide biosynthesis/export protein
MSNRILRTALIFLSAAAAAFAQSRPQNIDQQTASVANLPSHQIAPNDLIGLSVYDAPELTRTIRVGPDGLIDLPMLNGGIKAEGLLPNQLEAVIAAALKEQKILIKPIVTVTIMEYNSRFVTVMGAVHKPLTFPVVGTTRLLDALARAEGLTDESGPELLLTRNGATESEHIDLKELLGGSNQALNFPLEGGEQIRVPEARKIFVVGNVKKPGPIPVRDNSQSSILQLLAVVAGVTSYSADTAWIYRVEPGTIKRHEIPVELKKIMARKAPDVTLLPDDILYIPDNTGKRNRDETIKSVLMYGSAPLAAMIYAGVL